MRIFLIILLFLLIGAFFIISNENLRLNKEDGMKRFVGFYYSWFGSLFDNFKGISGYVIRSEWLPDLAENNKVNLSENASK